MLPRALETPTEMPEEVRGNGPAKRPADGEERQILVQGDVVDPSAAEQSGAEHSRAEQNIIS
jgi:hypothetical protein